MTDLLQDSAVGTNKLIEASPGCLLCPGNGKVSIVVDLGSMYLVHAKDKTMADLQDRWLIVPAEHVETPDQLPSGWGERLVELTASAGLSSGFNWNLNFGPNAGQTLPHLHWWALDRSTDDLGKGMAWMIDEIARLQQICLAMKAENLQLRKLMPHYWDEVGLATKNA